MNLQRGYSLLELMIAVTIASMLLIFGANAYTSALDRAKVHGAIGGIGEIHMNVQKFLFRHDRYPADLAEMGFDSLDPWGNPYVFNVLNAPGNGEARKDRNLVPVNRNYDVYSMGKDGMTATPFTSIVGSDDVVLAGDGTYFGLASKYSDR